MTMNTFRIEIRWYFTTQKSKIPQEKVQRSFARTKNMIKLIRKSQREEIKVNKLEAMYNETLI